jgi:23S rRNA (adenine1618-N6)-methyltransferase
MSRRRWKFFATGILAQSLLFYRADFIPDIDDHSLQYAERNIEANGLEDRITLHRSTAEGPLFPLDALHLHGLDFVMCNPPFYESTEELVTCATGKSRPPYTACTGSVTEMVTPGGEVAFVSRMIKESQVLQGRVSWYSSMLGKLSSVIAILEKLKGEGITNFAVAEFIQGTRTRRWAVAWSFLELKPRMDVARAVKGSGVPKHLLPYPSEYAIPVPSLDRATVGKRIDTIFDHLPLDDWDWSSPYGFGEAHGNVWSRSARRRMTRKRKICELIEQDMAKKVKLEPVDSKQEAEMSREMGALHKQGEEEEKELEVKSETEASDSSLHFYISVKDLHDMESTEMGALVVVWWVAGVDSAIFESLCGWLKRKLESQEDDLPPARPTGESSPSQMKLESPVKKIKEDVKLEDAEDDSTASVAQAGPIQHNVKDEADLTAIKPESL